MSRMTPGHLHFFRYPVLLFLLAGALFLSCVASPDTNETPDESGISLDVDSLDFGESRDTLSFMVTYTGEVIEWKLIDEGLPSWGTIVIKKIMGGTRVTVTVNREGLPAGKYTGSLAVKWSTGSRDIDIRMVVPELSDETGTILIDTKLPE